MIPLVPFSEMLDPEDEFVSVVDRPQGAIYQAFIACIPKHPILLYCLELSFYNIMSKKMDITTPALPLSYTGPIVAGQAFHIYMKNEDTNAVIIPKKYGKVNLDYVFKGDVVVRKSTNKDVINNKYENYDSINNYTTNQPYKNMKNIIILKKAVIILLIILLILYISHLIFRSEFIKCRSGCL